MKVIGEGYEGHPWPSPFGRAFGALIPFQTESPIPFARSRFTIVNSGFWGNETARVAPLIHERRPSASLRSLDFVPDEIVDSLHPLHGFLVIPAKAGIQRLEPNAMNIAINGHAVPTLDAATVSALLEQLKLSGQRIAVELNGEIVPRSSHAQTALKDGDKIEIVHAIGGG